MTMIKIQHPYTLTDKQLTEKLNKLAEEMKSKYQLSCNWPRDNCLQFRRAGADGEVVFEGNELQLTIKLGLMLSMFKATLQSDIEKFMRENIS
jgi:putative polyhydroxyalkanoate system protein